MKSTRRWLAYAGKASLLCMLVLSALPGRAKSTVAVSVHGVNYSNETFSYSVENPDDQKGPVAGELVDRFAAGGTVCCYELPTEWMPGIRVKVNSTHWLKKTPDGKLPEVKQVFILEVPPYADGKPGELWVLRHADGNVEVVSSDISPAHEKWTASVKGWPEPSVEFRREKISAKLEETERYLSISRSSLSAIRSDPEKKAGTAWVVDKANRRKGMEQFQGPNDPAYVRWLEERYMNNLQALEARLKMLREARQESVQPDQD